MLALRSDVSVASAAAIRGKGPDRPGVLPQDFHYDHSSELQSRVESMTPSEFLSNMTKP